MDVRNDFKILDDDLIYFDNAATSLKPKQVLKKMNEYYEEYCSNVKRGDYDISYKADVEYENARNLVQGFINAKYREEIIFTSGTTESLNMVVDGFFANVLEPNDEILITKSEHASNVLPWFKLCKNKGCKMGYIHLNKNYEVTLDSVKMAITPNTKVISIAHVSNVVGDIRPIKEIIEYAHQLGIFVVVDAAQSVPHMKIDVQGLDVDFLTFSAHKMCGPTGVGVLYGQKILLEKMNPYKLGGGMNEAFTPDTNFTLKELPTRLEAGTPNIAGVIGFGEAIKYLQTIGMDYIEEYVHDLKQYLISKLIHIPHIDILNIESTSGIVAFNVDGVFSQDVSFYLNKYNICVRAGNHCAKILKEETGVTNTVRISLYFYNTKDEIDDFIELISNKEKIMKEML